MPREAPRAEARPAGIRPPALRFVMTVAEKWLECAVVALSSARLMSHDVLSVCSLGSDSGAFMV